MTVCGVQIRFGCANGEQYDAIGEFWDSMRLCCPETELIGVGYGWQNDTFLYLIGTENGVPDGTEKKIAARFPGAVSTGIRLPDKGWKTYIGSADTLDVLYAEIYKDGALEYETEEFKPDGTAMIRVWRKGQ